ncbi:MAG: nitrite/sulfite reductase [Fibrobacterota bacterium]|nr:nitrite/sulfite reductase [Chitinispirillaceae bacterium]
MQLYNESLRRSDEEFIKEQGLTIDYNAIAQREVMTKEELLISKWYGVYQQRQSSDHMARIVIPGGKLTTSAARAIAEASKKFASGQISITTRQALQLHKLQLSQLPDFFRFIKENNLSTFHGCGDVVRTIPACPLAETCTYARINVLPYAVKALKTLTEMHDLDNLPRKFKINFSGCNASCGQTYMNCVGVNAIEGNVDDHIVKGFKVVIGGGMGWKAFVGQELFGFVTEDSIIDVLRAIALLFRDHGDRFNRAKSRTKFIVDNLGINKCREIILANLVNEHKTTDGIIIDTIDDIHQESIPARPLTEQDPVGTDGKVSVRILIPKGELTADSMFSIANLADLYGNTNVYTDNRQNLEIHGVSPSDVVTLKKEISLLNYKTDGNFGLDDIACCVGTTYCPRAVTETHSLFDKVHQLVSQQKYASIRYNGIINITGCPNACSPYRIADIGFRGARVRDEQGVVEGYEVLIGGDQIAHGVKIGEFTTDICVTLTEKILDSYLAESSTFKYINDFVRSKDITFFQNLLC